MNFRTLLNKIGCDDRIRGGYVDIKNPNHVVVLQEYLVAEGYDINEVVDKTAELFEAGRFPERQAYNKDGILVTFPTKEYKDRAINKGTHFAENPKKAQSNIYADELPADIQPQMDKPEKDVVTIDSELESEEQESDDYEDRSREEKIADAEAVDAILSNETPLVNYSVDEAKRYGFYNKGFNWYDSNGDLIGEQIFDEKLGKNVIEVDKTKKDVVKSNNKLSSEDIDILRKLGIDASISDEDIKNNIDIDVSNVTVSPGPNNKYGLTSPINISGLESILRKEEELVITYAGSVKKLRTRYNIRIVEWGIAKKINSINFQRVILMYNFYKQYESRINLLSREARGLGYEKMQVDNINGWFVDNEIKVPLHLYISDETKQFRDTGVSVNGARKLAGSGKADLAMYGDGQDRFWISYKQGDYWSESGKSLASVPFQQYGSIKTLNAKLGQVGKWGEIIRDFVNKMTSTVPEKMVIQKGQYIDEDVSGKYVVKSADGKIVDIIRNDKLIKSNFPTLTKIFSNEQNKNLNKILYFCPSGYNSWMDLLDGTPEAKEIAGMSIYGLDFKFGSKNYGPENVQCLIQTGEKLNLEYAQQNEETIGMKMSTDSKGHILFNPNLPAPEDANDPILIYRPVMNARYTEVENFTSTRKGNVDVFLGCRILVMPYGKIPGTSIQL